MDMEIKTEFTPLQIEEQTFKVSQRLSNNGHGVNLSDLGIDMVDRAE